MPIPDYQTLMRPLLAYGADGTEKSVREAAGALANQFNLTPDELEERVTNGKEALFRNRIRWAQTYLKKAGAMVRTRTAHFQITQRGISLLKQHPDRIDVTVLKQFPEFVAFQTRKTGDDTKAGVTTTSSPESAPAATPDEIITDAVAEIQSRLETDLIDRIAEQSPKFFEAMVVDLIVAMGYGGSRENIVQRIGRSGDHGIDGIVNEDALGLDVVYIQAKRYDRNNAVQREQVQSFAGALEGKRATKGIFVTTCSFTSGAKKYAESVHKRIILIDGQELVRLLIRYGVGVRVERDIQIKRVDLDYFDRDDL